MFQAIHEEMKSDNGFLEAKAVCLKELDLTEEDVKFDRYDDEIPEHALCFLRCIEKQHGFLDDQYNIVMTHLPEMPIFKHITEDEKNRIINCISEVDSVKECSDMKTVKKCIHKNLD